MLAHPHVRPHRQRERAVRSGPIAELNRLTNEALSDPKVKEKFTEQGLTAAGDTSEQFRNLIDSETAKWAKVIKDAGVPTTK